MSKKHKKPKSIRFKATMPDGKTYYVYQPDVASAVHVINSQYPGLKAAKVEEDTEKWETKLYEGRRAPGA